MLKRILSLTVALIMILSCNYSLAKSWSSNVNEAAYEKAADDLDSLKTPELNEQAKGDAKDDEAVRIMVQFEGKTALETKNNVKQASKYAEKIKENQSKAIDKIEKVLGKELANKKQYTLLFNGIAFEGSASDIDAINALDGMIAYKVPTFDLPEPEMTTSTGIVGAPYAWNLNYTGAGTTIAIIDTGILPTHEAFSVKPESLGMNISQLSAILEENGENMHCGNNASSLYKSDKIPFGYDYYYSDYTPNHTASDHGTHVAGIAAGNNGKGFKGIAYDAQVVVMQVFSSSGSAPWDVLLLALEDCAYLGVDSANMSLGSPAGFTSYADEGYEKAFELLDKAGILVASAAGNDHTTAYHNSRGGYQLAMNPDYGVVGSPSTYPYCLSVASSDNRTASSGYIYAYGNSISYNEPSSGASSITSIAGAHEYVHCALGRIGEFPSNVSGKIALVERGDITFTEKAENARAAGARAIIVYNNVAGNFTNISVESRIPFVTVSDTDGAFLTGKITEGVGTLEIKTGDAGAAYDNISSFSSRGSTADLKIKPEITAPGGAIYSSIGFGSDTSYSTWNGTSMATPHIAGGMAIVKSYVKDKLPDASNSELANITNAILMGSATPLKNEMVTAQGAGIMNLEAALSTNVYSTVNSERPKLEIDDSTDCRWQFSVELNNFGDEASVYSISERIIIEAPFAKDVSGNPDIYVTNGIPLDVTELCTISDSENGTVTVPAGETKTIVFSLDAKAVMDKYAECFPSGTYIEGFVKFNSDTDEISVPLLGFMGDWDYPAMFDRGFYWQSVTGELNLNSNGSISYNLAASTNKSNLAGIGLNPYISTAYAFDKFNPDWGAVSPNGDGVFDSLTYLQFANLRNVKTLEIAVTNDSGTEVVYKSDDYTFKKDLYYPSAGYTYTKYDMNYTGAGMSEGETAYITVTPMLDHEGYTPEANELGVWTIPVTYDTTAPSVFVDNGRIGVYDEHYAAYAAVYSNSSMTSLIKSQAFYGETRGETSFIDGCSGTVYVFAGDYAGNGASYIVNLDTGNVSNARPVGEYFENNTSSFTCSYDGAWTLATSDDTTLAYEGTGYIFSETADSENPDEIISPVINISSSYKSAFASFYTCAKTSDAPFEVYAVKGNESELIYSGNAKTDTWTKTSIDLSDYIGTSIKLAISHTAAKASGGLMVDAFEVCADKTDSHLLTFIAGDTVYSQGRYAKGDSIDYPEGEPDVFGYEFLGWEEDLPEYMPSYNIALHALLEKLPEFTVTFVDWDGTVISEQSVPLNTAAAAPENPTREGYTFTGWDKDFSCITGDLTVTAQYSINSYSVTFLDYDGTLLGTDTVEYGGSATAPENPTREGYDFTGWDSDFSCVKGDMTVTAQYEIKKYTVTFVDWDGTVLSEQQVEYQGSAAAPENPTREGHTFKCWDKDFSYITEDLTVTAQYDVNDYTVTYLDYDGTLLYTETVTYGTAATYSEEPHYRDHVFKAWEGADLEFIRGDVTVTASYALLGDTNADGLINTGDAVLLLRYIVFDYELTPFEAKVADVSFDGKLNAGDAILILRHTVDLLTSFEDRITNG